MSWARNRPGGRGYVNPKYRDPKHLREREIRYAAVTPSTLCSCGCGRPLGPRYGMSRNGTRIGLWHVPHAPNGIDYLPGVWRADCNRREGAQRAAAKSNALARAANGSGKCSHCGGPFVRRNATQRFCSKDCYQAILAKRASTPRATKPPKIMTRLGPPLSTLRPLAPHSCGWCGAATLKETFCSKQCYDAAYNTTRPRSARPPHQYACATCGLACQSAQPNAQYCSDACCKRAEKRRAAGKPYPSGLVPPRSDSRRAFVPRTW